MALTFLYDDPRDRFSEDDRQAVATCLTRSFEVCQEFLPGPKDIHFHVAVRRGENSKSLPVHGTAGGNNMSVIFDTRFPVYQFPDQHPCITTVIAHEWHHVVRELGVGYGKTLGQHLVSEGLAQAFEAQVMNDVPPIALALAKKRLRAFEDPIKGMLLKRDFQGFPEIFVGERGGTYPKWFGYSFGYHLVNEWLTQNGITASGAVNINAGKIIKPWRDGTISPFKNMSDLKSAHL